MVCVTVITIWNRERQDSQMEMRNHPRHGRFMKEEIGFTEAQMDNFKNSRSQLREIVRPIHIELRNLNHELINESISNKPDTAKCDSLIKMIGEKNIELKRAISRHLIQVSSTATPDQKEKLKEFYLGMFSNAPMGEGQGRQFRHGMYNN